MNTKTRSIPQFADDFGIGRTRIYELINSGQLAAVKCGRRTFITEEAAQAWLSSLPAYPAKNGGAA